MVTAGTWRCDECTYPENAPCRCAAPSVCTCCCAMCDAPRPRPPAAPQPPAHVSAVSKPLTQQLAAPSTMPMVAACDVDIQTPSRAAAPTAARVEERAHARNASVREADQAVASLPVKHAGDQHVARARASVESSDDEAPIRIGRAVSSRGAHGDGSRGHGHVQEQVFDDDSSDNPSRGESESGVGDDNDESSAVEDEDTDTDALEDDAPLIVISDDSDGPADDGDADEAEFDARIRPNGSMRGAAVDLTQSVSPGAKKRPRTALKVSPPLAHAIIDDIILSDEELDLTRVDVDVRGAIGGAAAAASQTDTTQWGEFPHPLLPYFRPVQLLQMQQFFSGQRCHVDFASQFRGACAPIAAGAPLPIGAAPSQSRTGRMSAADQERSRTMRLEARAKRRHERDAKQRAKEAQAARRKQKKRGADDGSKPATKASAAPRAKAPTKGARSSTATAIPAASVVRALPTPQPKALAITPATSSRVPVTTQTPLAFPPTQTFTPAAALHALSHARSTGRVTTGGVPLDDDIVDDFDFGGDRPLAATSHGATAMAAAPRAPTQSFWQSRRAPPAVGCHGETGSRAGVSMFTVKPSNAALFGEYRLTPAAGTSSTHGSRPLHIVPGVPADVDGDDEVAPLPFDTDAPGRRSRPSDGMGWEVRGIARV